ncbi:DDE-domain-containing protein, partial [Schizopora paradoxa]
MFNSSPLERSRTQAANPTNHKLFFDILESTLKTYNIEPDCIYAMDETGFMPGRACVSKVIGKAGKREQKSKESGNRSNITVLPVICADGTSLPPLVIFSGKAFAVAWEQNNPLRASFGYQKKGYIDNELGVEWIKQIDKATKAKANGRDRGLLVDGHRSRLTYEFLEHAKRNRIHVVCYAAHTTQLYQGLDKVIFGVLKRRFSEEMKKFEERTGQAVKKENFLTVYTPAHIAAFTEANIKAAFEKTGVCPLNRDAISPEALKISIESSCLGDGLPLPQPSPVK